MIRWPFTVAVAILLTVFPFRSLQAQSSPDIDSLTPIYTIQGSGAASPLVKKRVDTYGLVTAVTNNGFYLQDPIGDDDPSTSDGVFVYTRTRPNQTAGNCIALSDAFVDEYYEKTELTELRGRSIQPFDGCSRSISPVAVPFAQLFTDPQSLFERYEGMLVSFEELEGIVHGPTKRFNSGDAEIAFVSSNANRHLTAGRIFQWQSAEKNAIMYLSTPDGTTFPELGWGDEIQVVSKDGPTEPFLAVLDYNFGKYQIILLDDSLVVGEDLPFSDDSVPPTLEDEITVCTFNILGLGKGSAQYAKPDVYDVELEKRALAIAETLNGCTIIGLQETGKPDDVTNLANLLRDKHELDYEPIAVAGPMTRNPEFPLTNSFLVLRDRVSVNGFELRQACTRLNYDVRYQPGVCERGTYGLFSRPPLVLDVSVSTENGPSFTLTIINNHWKSKGGDEEVNVVRREAQALHVADLVQEKLDTDATAHVIVLGDLNDFYNSGPVNALIAGTSPPMVHTYEFLPTLDRYTYTFNGASQVLDHILVTQGLVPMIASVDPVHINADYPYALVTDPTTVFHASDHDPVVLRLTPAGTGWLALDVGYSGVVVSVLDQQGADVAQATSDELGDIRMWGIAPGTYELALVLPEHLIATDLPTDITINAGPNELEISNIQHSTIKISTSTLFLSPLFGDLLSTESHSK